MPTTPSESSAASGWEREWDVASCSWHNSATLLDQGYEPFAVTTNGPNNAGEITVYMRRRRVY